MEMEKALPAVMGAMFGLVMVVAVVNMTKAMQPAPPPPQYTCPVCGEKFNSQAELEEHIAIVHPTPLGYSCPYCSDTFSTLDELVSHVASVHPDKPPILPIEIIWGD